MLEQTYEYRLSDLNLTTKTLSLHRDTVVKSDGVEIARSIHSCAFGVGDIEAAKAYLGADDTDPLVIYLTALLAP